MRPFARHAPLVLRLAGLGAANGILLWIAARWTRRPPPAEYALTGGLLDAWWALGFAAIPAQVLIGWLFGRFGGVRWRGALLGCVAVYLVAAIGECARSPSAHNLIPFELAFWAAACLPVSLGVLLAHRDRIAGEAPREE